MSSVIAKMKKSEIKENTILKEKAKDSKFNTFVAHISTFVTVAAHNMVHVAIYSIIMVMIVYCAIYAAMYGVGLTVGQFGATAMASVADVVVIYTSAITVSGFVLYFSTKLINRLFKELSKRLWHKSGFDIIKGNVCVKKLDKNDK